jgi:uncharacterized membrane protein
MDPWLWMAWCAILITGGAHLVFFYAETVTSRAEKRLRPKFRIADSVADPVADPMVKVLFQNQGVYNLLLGVGILWRLFAVSTAQLPNDSALLYLLFL